MWWKFGTVAARFGEQDRVGVTDRTMVATRLMPVGFSRRAFAARMSARSWARWTGGGGDVSGSREEKQDEGRTVVGDEVDWGKDEISDWEEEGVAEDSLAALGPCSALMSSPMSSAFSFMTRSVAASKREKSAQLVGEEVGGAYWQS